MQENVTFNNIILKKSQRRLGKKSTTFYSQRAI